MTHMIRWHQLGDGTADGVGKTDGNLSSFPWTSQLNTGEGHLADNHTSNKIFTCPMVEKHKDVLRTYSGKPYLVQEERVSRASSEPGTLS